MWHAAGKKDIEIGIKWIFTQDRARARSSSSSDEKSPKKPASKKQRGKKSSKGVQKALNASVEHREVDSPEARFLQAMDELSKAWKCMQQACPNFGFHCLILKGNRHATLSMEARKKNPPMDLHLSLAGLGSNAPAPATAAPPAPPAPPAALGPSGSSWGAGQAYPGYYPPPNYPSEGYRPAAAAAASALHYHYYPPQPSQQPPMPDKSLQQQVEEAVARALTQAAPSHLQAQAAAAAPFRQPAQLHAQAAAAAIAQPVQAIARATATLTAQLDKRRRSTYSAAIEAAVEQAAEALRAAEAAAAAAAAALAAAAAAAAASAAAATADWDWPILPPPLPNLAGGVANLARCNSDAELNRVEQILANRAQLNSSGDGDFTNEFLPNFANDDIDELDTNDSYPLPTAPTQMEPLFLEPDPIESLTSEMSELDPTKKRASKKRAGAWSSTNSD
ncbi:MAG: hypothetical protein M1829_000866 [Trizodia sp. TS-e1964]|nr:MAG: hypothetical protein M1829_000866 [Trizodia sp. TS-e1964]